jgi:hypothetical protein
MLFGTKRNLSSIESRSEPSYPASIALGIMKPTLTPYCSTISAGGIFSAKIKSQAWSGNNPLRINRPTIRRRACRPLPFRAPRTFAPGTQWLVQHVPSCPAICCSKSKPLASQDQGRTSQVPIVDWEPSNLSVRTEIEAHSKSRCGRHQSGHHSLQELIKYRDYVIGAECGDRPPK